MEISSNGQIEDSFDGTRYIYSNSTTPYPVYIYLYPSSQSPSRKKAVYTCILLNHVSSSPFQPPLWSTFDHHGPFETLCTKTKTKGEP